MEKQSGTVIRGDGYLSANPVSRAAKKAWPVLLAHWLAEYKDDLAAPFGWLKFFLPEGV